MEKVAMRPIYMIAGEIRREWKNPYFGAVPYLQAMFSLEDSRCSYGEDSAKSIVIYFLSNAQSFRGPKAKELKAELKSMFNIK